MRALDLVRSRLVGVSEPGPLRALGERLAGELLGETERSAAVIADSFQLVTRAGGSPIVMDREAVLQSLRTMGDAGAVTWIEVEGLVVDGDTLALHGAMCSMRPSADHSEHVALSASPVAIFVCCADGSMITEELYLDVPGTTTAVVPGELPDRALLAAAVAAAWPV